MAGIFILALGAFELFNFDTTRFALQSVLGHVTFIGVGWATLLALAFCAIDFAGITHLFSPENHEDSRETWFLLGAWLLGATMNALMTWWAVSLTLIDQPIGNEILSQAQLLNIVPILVAVLVWLTRILFIGGLSVAGNHLLQTQASTPQPQPVSPAPPTPQKSSPTRPPRTTRKAPAKTNH